MIKEKDVKMYMTTDGKHHYNIEDAEEHQKILNKIKYVKFCHCPDLTEGRRQENINYLKLVGVENRNLEKIAEYILYKLYGNKYAFIQGQQTNCALVKTFDVLQIVDDIPIHKKIAATYTMDDCKEDGMENLVIHDNFLKFFSFKKHE